MNVELSVVQSGKSLVDIHFRRVIEKLIMVFQ